MQLFRKCDSASSNDLPWMAETEEIGRIPVIVGLIIAGLLVAAIGVWQLGSSVLPHSSFIIDSSSQDNESNNNSSENDLTAAGVVCVHIIGSVRLPGVYTIPAQSRVCDAIELAGGFSDDAALDALNLARVVSDGEQIVIPSNEEVQAASLDTSISNINTSRMIVNGKVNINSADSSTLQTLSGIGPSTAEKIILDRESNGPFTTIEDLKRVSGIGDKKYASIVDSICVG